VGMGAKKGILAGRTTAFGLSGRGRQTGEAIAIYNKFPPLLPCDFD
jgi:hypothetical protein